MAALLLTRENHDALKDALRGSCPDIGSSHASEALACAFGFRTHAALLNASGAFEGPNPLLVRACDIRLATRLLELTGQCHAFSLIETVRAGLPRPIWRAFKRQDLWANNAWFHDCQRRNMPFIYLHPGRQYVRLNWDCVTTQHNYDHHIRGEAGNALASVMYHHFCDMAQGDRTKAFFEGSAFVGDIKGLLPATAMRLADDLFELLYAPAGSRKQAA